LQALLRFFKTLWFAEVATKSRRPGNDTYGRLIRPADGVPLRSAAWANWTSRISADLTQIQDTLIWTIPQFLRQLALMVGGLALLIFTSGRLPLAMLLSLPILIAASAFFGRAHSPHARESQDRLADSLVIVEETLRRGSVKGSPTSATNPALPGELASVSIGRAPQRPLPARLQRFRVFALFGPSSSSSGTARGWCSPAT